MRRTVLTPFSAIVQQEQSARSEQTPSDSAAERFASYTHVREDIASLVPDDALRILDVGCSNGALGGALKARVRDRHVTGIEFDAELASQAGLALDAVVRADLEAIDIADATRAFAPFDCIVCADVLEHLRDPWQFVKKLVPLLRRTGSLIVSMPNVRHHSALGTIAIKGRFPRRSRGIFDATHLHWFTWHEGVELLHHAGLEFDIANYAVRIGDRGGGRVNRLADRLLTPIAGIWIVREFFVYQFAIRARWPRNAVDEGTETH